MSGLDLKKLKRNELIDIIYAFQQNEKKLNSRISLLESNSQSDADTKVYRVMEAAVEAADAYLAEAKAKADKEAQEIIEEAEAKAKEIIDKANERSAKKRKALEEAIDAFCKDNPSINVERKSLK